MDNTMNTGNAEALRYLIEKVSAPGEKLVHETALEKHVLISQGNGSAEVQIFKKDRPKERHGFTTLAGLLDYLTEVHPNDHQALVMVGEDAITVDLDYKGPLKDTLSMTLNDSPEYEALKMLQNGVRQQDLWKLLNNQLHGCVDPSLKMAIKDIKVTTRQESSCTINPFGIVNQSGGVFHELVFPSDKPGEQPDKKAISPDWEFELSIFECFDHPVKISTSLEIDKSSGGLTFTFTPRRIERVVSNERLALVSHLREALKEHGNINVLEGENTGLTV